MQAILDRDRRLLSTLLGAPSTFGALDDLIYGGDVRDVIPWASSVTMAHLRRLEEAGLLSRRPDGRYMTEALAAERYLREIALLPA
jgi:DNA-binding MarR family transcriptional regulator